MWNSIVQKLDIKYVFVRLFIKIIYCFDYQLQTYDQVDQMVLCERMTHEIMIQIYLRVLCYG